MSAYEGDDPHSWRRNILGHDFNLGTNVNQGGEGLNTQVVNNVGSWLHNHEEAQVMLASVLVVLGIWWLVRSILALIVNLLFPLLVVLMALICVPQLRAPLMGQNYPLLVEMLRNILLKLAENIKS